MLRRHAVAAGAIAAAALLILPATPDVSADGKKKGRDFETRLEGAAEVPVVSTTARGSFQATLSKDRQSLDYELSFSGMTGQVRQSHIHLGRALTNGGIMVFLCQSATNPDPTGEAPFCEDQGTFVGTITNANIIGPGNQGIASGEFEEFVEALTEGYAYVNVHTSVFPSGEIRGQVERRRGKDD